MLWWCAFSLDFDPNGSTDIAIITFLPNFARNPLLIESYDPTIIGHVRGEQALLCYDTDDEARHQQLGKVFRNTEPSFRSTVTTSS